MTEIAQRSAEWLAWRSEGIGSSEVGAILGVSPYMSALDLYNEKLGLKPPFQGNWATDRGAMLEPAARAQFELLMSAEFAPTIMVHETHSYLRASLDGFNKDLESVLEIKCPGTFDHETALRGKVPEKYLYQVQYQLLVSGAKKVYYYSFDGQAGCIVEVLPDPTIQSELFERVTHFWFNHIVAKAPPEPSSKDFIELTDESNMSLFKSYADAKQQFDFYAKLVSEIRGIIAEKFSEFKYSRVKCSGVGLTRSEKDGEKKFTLTVKGN